MVFCQMWTAACALTIVLLVKVSVQSRPTCFGIWHFFWMLLPNNSTLLIAKHRTSSQHFYYLHKVYSTTWTMIPVFLNKIHGNDWWVSHLSVSCVNHALSFLVLYRNKSRTLRYPNKVFQYLNLCSPIRIFCVLLVWKCTVIIYFI